MPKMLVLQLVPLVLKSLLMLPLCLHFVPTVVLLRSDLPFVFFPFCLPLTRRFYDSSAFWVLLWSAG